MITSVNTSSISFQAKNKIEKPQIIEVPEKNNKKKVALALTGLAALGIAGVVLSKKLPSTISILNTKGMNKRSLDLVDDASKLKKEAAKLYDDAKNVADDVLSKIKQAFTSNSSAIKEENGKKVFEEIADGVLQRKSVFTQNADDIIVNTVESFNANGLKDAIIVKKGKPVILLNGLKGNFKYSGKSLSVSDAEEVGKIFFYNDKGDLGLVQKGSKRLSDKVSEVAREFRFKQGKLSSAKEGLRYTTNPSITEVARQFHFKDDSLVKVQQTLGTIKTSFKENVLDVISKKYRETVFKLKK